jgi:hypothetical protein
MTWISSVTCSSRCLAPGDLKNVSLAIPWFCLSIYWPPAYTSSLYLGPPQQLQIYVILLLIMLVGNEISFRLFSLKFFNEVSLACLVHYTKTQHV